MAYDPQPTPNWKRWRNRTVTQRVHTPDPALQPPLPEAPARPSKRTDLTIDQRFLDWCQANPGVLRVLRQMALERVAAGDTRIGVKALIEDLRRRPGGLSRVPGEMYQIDNSYTSRIARVLNDDPRLAGLIELRSLRGE